MFQNFNMHQREVYNVVVFGETGTGKSSVVNMILGSDKAPTSGGASGCTFDSKAYNVEIEGCQYVLYDTIGLGEGLTGTVDASKAIGVLHDLLTKLSKSGGIHLLLFVMRRGRCTHTIQKNYELFYNAFCERGVPIVAVVTGCEDVDSPTMDSWWMENEETYSRAGMTFNGYACVCAFKGTLTRQGYYRNEDLVDESKQAVRNLIMRHCAQRGWRKLSVSTWFRQILSFVMTFFHGPRHWRFAELRKSLVEAGFPVMEVDGIIAAMK